MLDDYQPDSTIVVVIVLVQTAAGNEEGAQVFGGIPLGFSSWREHSHRELNTANGLFTSMGLPVHTTD